MLNKFNIQLLNDKSVFSAKIIAKKITYNIAMKL